MTTSSEVRGSKWGWTRSFRGPALVPGGRRRARVGGAHAGGGPGPARADPGRHGIPAALSAPGRSDRDQGQPPRAGRGRDPGHVAAGDAAASLRRRRRREGALRAPAPPIRGRCCREPARAGRLRRDGSGGRAPGGGVPVAPGVGGVPRGLPIARALRVRGRLRAGPGGRRRSVSGSAGNSAHRPVVPGALRGPGRPTAEDLPAPLRGRRRLRQRPGGTRAGAVRGVLPTGCPPAADGPVRRPGQPPAPAVEAAGGLGPEPAGGRGRCSPSPATWCTPRATASSLGPPRRAAGT